MTHQANVIIAWRFWSGSLIIIKQCVHGEQKPARCRSWRHSWNTEKYENSAEARKLKSYLPDYIPVIIINCTVCTTSRLSFLRRHAFARTNRRAIAMMFVRLSGTGVHCCHTVHVNADLSVRLDSPMFWAPWYQSMSTYSQPSFSTSTWKRDEVWMCKLGEALNAINDK